LLGAQSRADTQLIGHLLQDRKKSEDLAHLSRSRHRGLIEVSAQSSAQSRHPFRRPVREVGEGAVLDLAVLAEGLAQQDRRGRVAVGHDCDVHANINSISLAQSQDIVNIYMTTI